MIYIYIIYMIYMLQLCDCVSKITLHTVMHHTMFRCDTSGFLLWPFLWPDMTWPYVTQVPPPKQRFQAPRSYPDAPTSAVSWRSPAHFVEDWVHHGASWCIDGTKNGGPWWSVWFQMSDSPRILLPPSIYPRASANPVCQIGSQWQALELTRRSSRGWSWIS
jgi:hypothetical protein